MKPRRVMLTLEVETDAPLTVLRDATQYAIMDVRGTCCQVIQAQANVVKLEKAGKKMRRT